MKTINRFCRDCYQTTPHVIRYLGGEVYECNVCKESEVAIWAKESKKEENVLLKEIEVE